MVKYHLIRYTNKILYRMPHPTTSTQDNTKPIRNQRSCWAMINFRDDAYRTLGQNKKLGQPHTIQAKCIRGGRVNVKRGHATPSESVRARRSVATFVCLLKNKKMVGSIKTSSIFFFL